MSTLIKVENLCKSFGGLAAVKDISLQVEAGKIVSLIGPNGAGKTTVFNLLSGFYQPDSGTVTLDGKRINGLAASAYVKHGLVRTFQNVRLFASMTVLDNVLVGLQHTIHYSTLDMLLNTAGKKRVEAEAQKTAMDLLSEMNLGHLTHERCGELPYGIQKKLEIVRALASNPKLLLLDEPAAGLNPQESAELSAFVRSLTQRGVTVLLIEHDLNLVMGISDYVYVMNHGEMLSEGTPNDILHDDCVIEAYIGKRGLASVAGYQ